MFNPEMNKEKWIMLILGGLFLAGLVVPLVRNGVSSVSTQKTWESPGIGVLTISGPIDAGASDDVFGSDGLTGVIHQIHAHRDDPYVKALIVRINSPGGTVGASQELYSELIDFKKKSKKPVIVSIADIGASGAYWVALAGDVILANPGSLVGSIGVIMTGLDLQQVPNRYGISMRTYKSGKYKDMLSSWRPVTDEETQLLQSMLDDVHGQFIATVVAERHIPTASVLTLAQGQVFSGRQAKAARLIDRTGGFSDAIALAKTKARITGDPELIDKSEPSFRDLFRGVIGAQVRLALRDMQVAINGPKIQ